MEPFQLQRRYRPTNHFMDNSIKEIFYMFTIWWLLDLREALAAFDFYILSYFKDANKFVEIKFLHGLSCIYDRQTDGRTDGRLTGRLAGRRQAGR